MCCIFQSTELNLSLESQIYSLMASFLTYLRKTLTVFSINSLLPSLLIPKKQIDPRVQMLRNIIGFQCVAHHPHKVLRTLRPRRQFHIIHLDVVVPVPEIDPEIVHQKRAALLRVVELWNKLLEIAHIIQGILTQVRQRVEHPVRMVEATVLQAQHVLGIQADQVEEDEARRRVVRAVDELRLGHFLVAFHQLRQADFIQGAHRLGQIPIRTRTIQVYLLRREVQDRPRKHRVLRQVVFRPIT